MGEHVAPETPKTSMSSRSGGSNAFEYLSKAKSEGMVKEDLRIGLGEEAVACFGRAGIFRCKVVVLRVIPLAWLCFFRSETMPGMPLGVVTLMSDSVSSEVDAVISREKRGDQAVLAVLGVSAAAL